jgi:hypothetical protein
VTAETVSKPHSGRGGARVGAAANAVSPTVVRGKQDENSASIGVRKCRRMRDERRAQPD